MGEDVTIKANAIAGREFKEWEFSPGTPVLVDGYSISDDEIRFFMPANALSATATYLQLVTSVTITGATNITTDGGELQLGFTVAPGNADIKTVTWSIVSGGDFAEINATTGLLKAKANGDVKVRATANDNSGEYDEIVIEIIGQIVLVSSITVTSINGEYSITTDGGELQLTTDVLPANATNKDVTWSIVSGGDFAEINATTGFLKAKANGDVKVRATANDNSGKYHEIDIEISGQIVPPVMRTVTFIYDNGKTDDLEISVEEGNTVEEPSPAPTKDDFWFVGWFEEGAEESFDFDTPVTVDFTLTAMWIPIGEPPYYTVTITPPVNGFISVRVGNLPIASGRSLADGTVLTLRATAREGYEFVSWWDGDSESPREFTLNGNVVISATFIEVVPPAIYTVTFDYNDRVRNPLEVEVEEGNTVEAPAEPTRINYTFMGWYLDNIEFSFDTPITANITLIAEWELSGIPPATYTVTFDYNDENTVSKEVTVVEGGKIEKPTNPTRNGYTFLGWIAGNDMAWNFDTGIVTENMTLTAKWEIFTNSGEIQTVNPLTAWISNGKLRVTGLTSGETLSIYTATGALIHNGIATSEEAEISLTAQGIYIVRQGSNTVRVVFNN